MTNEERLKSLLGFVPSDDNSLEGTMIDFGIVSGDTYTASNKVLLNKCAVSIMQLLLTTADTKNENGYEIKYDRDLVLKRIELIQQEEGTTPVPVISSKTVW